MDRGGGPLTTGSGVGGAGGGGEGVLSLSHSPDRLATLVDDLLPVPQPDHS